MIEWNKISKPPEPGRSYLVLMQGVGLTADVAFYNGKTAGGSHWWILGNVDLDADMITHWAEINYPEEG